MKNGHIAINRKTGKEKRITETHNGFVIIEDGKELHTSSYGFIQDYKIRSLEEIHEAEKQLEKDVFGL